MQHRERAFLAVAVAIRYEAEPETPFLQPARSLMDPALLAQADALGFALRLAAHLSAGTPALLARARLARDDGRLVLTLARGQGLLGGDSTARRLDRLAASLGLAGVMAVVGGVRRPVRASKAGRPSPPVDEPPRA